MNNALRAIPCLLLLFVCGLVAAKDTLLIIESYHPEFEWDLTYKRSIGKQFANDYNIATFAMDTKRLPPEQHQSMADKAWDYYLQIKPKLVFLGDDAALKFLAKRFANTDTPVVYLGINNNPRAYFDPNKVNNIVGVLERPLIKQGLISIKQLLPKAQKGLVLFDNDITSQVIQQDSFASNSRKVINNMTLELVLIPQWEVWQQTVKDKLGQYDFIVIGSYQAVHDAHGEHIPADNVITWVSKHASVPVFSFWDFAVGADKAVGGMVLEGSEQGRLAAEIAQKILHGTLPNKLQPLIAEKGKLLFSRKQLQHYQLTIPDSWKQRVHYVD